MSFNVVDGPFIADSAIAFDSTTPDVALGASVAGDGSAIPGDFSVTAIFRLPELAEYPPIGTLTDVPFLCVSGTNVAADVAVVLKDYSYTLDDEFVLTANVLCGGLTFVQTFNYGESGRPSGSFGTEATGFGLVTLTRHGDDYYLYIGGSGSAEGLMDISTPTSFGSRGIFLGCDGRGNYIESKWADVWVHGKALTLADHQALLTDLEDNDGSNVLPQS